MRVARGAQRDEHAAIDPDMELAITRGFEMAFEAIPGSILQVQALLLNMQGGGAFSRVALGSIIVSALTTGFSAATISFE
jgi:hypothetical protein